MTATAHKLARLVYSMLRYGTAYVDPGQQAYEQGAALLEHYVCVISPVEDESLSPDVVRVMSVSVRWPWRSGLHDAA